MGGGVPPVFLQQSLYDLLGVSPAATQEAIKEAFFARSKEIHPDLHPDEPGAVEQFQHLAAAYEACFTEKFAFGKVADHMQYAIVCSSWYTTNNVRAHSWLDGVLHEPGRHWSGSSISTGKPGGF